VAATASVLSQKNQAMEIHEQKLRTVTRNLHFSYDGLTRLGIKRTKQEQSLFGNSNRTDVNFFRTVW
jgi:hypothetical protein